MRACIYSDYTAMSIASTASSVQVGFRGTASTLENAMRTTIRELQSHLNNAEIMMCQIATLVEQDAPFRDEVKLSDDFDDDIRGMCWLFEDLRTLTYGLISIPDEPEDRIWFRAHKAQRKLDEKKLQAEHAAKNKADRAAEKAALKAGAALGAVAEEEGK